LLHADLVPHAEIEGVSENQFQAIRTEWHVILGHLDLGHEFL
jgi:hypothetical protein